MATLNARQSIRSAADDIMTVSLQAGSLPVTSEVYSRSIHGFLSGVFLQRQPSNIAIKVDTVQEYSQDHQYEDPEVRLLFHPSVLHLPIKSQFLDMDETKINREGGKAV